MMCRCPSKLYLHFRSAWITPETVHFRAYTPISILSLLYLSTMQIETVYQMYLIEIPITDSKIYTWCGCKTGRISLILANGGGNNWPSAIILTSETPSFVFQLAITVAVMPLSKTEQYANAGLYQAVNSSNVHNRGTSLNLRRICKSLSIVTCHNRNHYFIVLYSNE